MSLLFRQRPVPRALLQAARAAVADSLAAGPQLLREQAGTLPEPTDTAPLPGRTGHAWRALAPALVPATCPPPPPSSSVPHATRVSPAGAHVASPWDAPHGRRALSTHVGHGSGGREHGHNLHEPPEGHPFAVKGLNHIALAVPSVGRAAEHYRTVFGAQVSDPHSLPEHGVTVIFVHVGSTTIELLEPLGEGSPIAKFLEKHPKGGLHHLCFTVDNIEVATQHVVDEGVRVLGDYSAKGADAAAVGGEKPAVQPKIGAHGNPVIFLDPRDNLGVLCELEQVFCHER